MIHSIDSICYLELIVGSGNISPQPLSPFPSLTINIPKHHPTFDPAAKIATTALVDVYHPSLGPRVPPTIIEAGATISHLTIVYASDTVHSATIGDRCTLHPHFVVKSWAVMGEGCII
jgi:UDP-3-O-[3-hydroxymyristoyl] glucosamine N-acyltransferase